MPALKHRCLLILLVAAPQAIRAQNTDSIQRVPADSNAALNLFLDCRAPGCDFNYLRTELTWINYVRDRTDAQVHVIATALGTGSGGLEVKLAFIGLKQFAGVNNEVTYSTQRGASGDELRQEFTRVLKLGLVQYMLGTRLGSHLTVSYLAPPNAPPAQHERDPWNFWVFSIGLNGSVGGESRSNGRSGSGSLYASRTTAAWKFRANANGSTSRNSYQLDDTSTYVARSHGYSGGAVLVRSISDHLSIGGGFGVSSSTTNNLELAVRVAPTVEFDFFKYNQYTQEACRALL